MEPSDLARRVRDDFAEVEYEHEGDEQARRGRGRGGDGLDNVERHSVAMRHEQGRLEQHEEGMIECSRGGQVLVFAWVERVSARERAKERARQVEELTHEIRHERDVVPEGIVERLELRVWSDTEEIVELCVVTREDNGMGHETERGNRDAKGGDSPAQN